MFVPHFVKFAWELRGQSDRLAYVFRNPRFQMKDDWTLAFVKSWFWGRISIDMISIYYLCLLLEAWMKFFRSLLYFYFDTTLMSLFPGTPTPVAAKVNVPNHIPYLLVGAGTASFAAFRAIKSNDPKAKVNISFISTKTICLFSLVEKTCLQFCVLGTCHWWWGL